VWIGDENNVVRKAKMKIPGQNSVFSLSRSNNKKVLKFEILKFYKIYKIFKISQELKN
jgi:hypothetical protein